MVASKARRPTLNHAREDMLSRPVMPAHYERSMNYVESDSIVRVFHSEIGTWMAVDVKSLAVCYGESPHEAVVKVLGGMIENRAEEMGKE